MYYRAILYNCKNADKNIESVWVTDPEVAKSIGENGVSMYKATRFNIEISETEY